MVVKWAKPVTVQAGGSRSDRDAADHPAHRRDRSPARSLSRGHQRERQVRKELEKEGWLVVRAGGSLGIADLVALKAHHQPRILEVKSDDEKFGPFNNFGPKRRAKFLAAAGHAGAEPLLAYWPPYGKLQYLGVDLWP